jgi:S-adenosylmethionine hydrolase
MPIGELGPVLNAGHIYKRPKKRCAFSVQGDIAGEISYVDRFGNLGTNIDRDSVTQLMNRSLKGVIEVEICGWHIRGLAKTYAEGEPDRLIALVNSRKRLEIAVNGGSAFKLISAGPGTAVRVTAKKNTIGPGINV